ncbi:sulfurtransferase TusA family protein [Brevundimonas sp. NPDC003935]|uniref:sulfurtransferase TusA family protein n=1 Tax=unclassified Brevundimonas TaxID=2622653 RepID=UPI0036C66AF7
MPSLRLRRAMEGAAPGARLTLLATDPMARIDVPYLMGDLGGKVCGVEEQDGVLRITVETGGVPTD